MAKEIERKFLVKQIPAEVLEKQTSQYIVQNYLSVGEEEIRYRRVVSKQSNEKKFYMTIKRGTGISREENEFEILEETYNQLRKNLRTEPIVKTRFKIQTDMERIYDLDIYENPLLEDEGLITIEVEFENEELAKEFVPPKWFEKDVTNDKNYKNQNLWLRINNIKTSN